MLRSLLAVLIAAIAAITWTGAASADSVLISPGGSFTATASNLTLSNGLATITCSATLTGSVATSTVISSPTTTVGRVTGLTFSCAGATVRALGLPWTLDYTGVLLDANGIPTGYAFAIPNAQIETTVAGIACLYSGALNYLELLDARGQSRTMTLLSSSLTRVTGICGSSGTARGIFGRAVAWLFGLSPMAAANAVNFAAAPGVPQIVTLQNLSALASVSVLSIAKGGTNPGEFAFDYVGIPAGDSCAPVKIVPAGRQCRVRVRYIGTLNPATATLDFGMNSTFFPTVTAQLIR